MGLQEFIENNGASMSPEFIRALEDVGVPLILTAVGIPPGDPLSLDLSMVATVASAPFPPPPTSIAFLVALASDITLLVLTPIRLGAANLKTPAAIGLPAAPINPLTTTLAPLVIPPTPNLMKAIFQWIVSLMLPVDPRVPGGFTVT